MLLSGGENEATVTNLLEVKETGLTTERFMKIVRGAGYRILFSRFYIINPNYEVKFHLKPLKQCPLIARIPVIRNFFTTSVYYLLCKEPVKPETNRPPYGCF